MEELFKLFLQKVQTRCSRIRWWFDSNPVTVTDWQAFGQSDWQVEEHSINQIDRLTGIRAILRIFVLQLFSDWQIEEHSVNQIDRLTGIRAIRLTSPPSIKQNQWQHLVTTTDFQHCRLDEHILLQLMHYFETIYLYLHLHHYRCWHFRVYLY